MEAGYRRLIEDEELVEGDAYEVLRDAYTDKAFWEEFIFPSMPPIKYREEFKTNNAKIHSLVWARRKVYETGTNSD